MKFNRRLTFDSLDSTNTYLKEHHSFPHLTLVRARYQTAGRGQFDRTWIADPNLNFLFSLLWKKQTTLVILKKIEGAMIQAILSFLKEEFALLARHKMPNDIYIGKKKIAGFLIETNIEEGQIQSFVIGIGLNMNQTRFPEGIVATSVLLETQQKVPIDVYFERLMTKIKTYLATI